MYSADLSKASYAVTGALARAVSKAVCADPALFTQVQDTLINDNSMLTQLIVVNVYRLDPGQLGAVSAAANQIFREQSELACEVMT